MRLTQIKLAGFKSFVDPTSIPVPSMLVGVVGPNGCGKSNIIDAVRWVLGETRASELRGESMQDVIFNGSGQRKPGARASVELVFDNEAGRAAGQWSQYAEVAVRRVLTRDGTSSYFINNQLVRRRDINDIFLGTGLGARGYAIIGQGMINRIIEARPEELRVFLEEAAGVSRYKERRRETANRMADTRENLTRVEDILRELQSQLERLESQAQVARRYQDLQVDGERKLHALWWVRQQAATLERQQLAEATAAAETALEAAQAKLRNDQTRGESLRQAHYDASAAVHQAQTALYEANTEVNRLETELRFQAENRNRLIARRDQLQRQKAEAQTELDDGAASEAALDDDAMEAAARAEGATLQAEDAAQALPAAEHQVREAQAKMGLRRDELARVEQELALVAQRQREASRQREQLSLRQERLRRERSELARPDDDHLARLTGDLAAASTRVESAEADWLALERRLPVLDEARRVAQQAGQQSAATLSGIEARLAALVALQEDVQRQGTLQPWLEQQGLAQRTRLWQRIKVEPGWETAVEAVLQERLAALELQSVEVAGGFLRDPPPARLAFFQRAGASGAGNAGLAGATPLMAQVQVDDAELRAVLAGWLEGVFIQPDLDSALRTRRQLPSGACWVIQQGHRVDAQGVRFHAVDSDQAGMLARQQEITNLQQEQRAHALIVDEARSTAAREEAAYQQAAQGMPALRQRLAEVTAQRHNLQIEHERLQQMSARVQAESGRLDAELTDVAEQLDMLHAVSEESEMQFEVLDERLAELQSAQADLEMVLEAAQATLEQQRQRLRDCERAAQEATFAERAVRARREELQRNLTRASLLRDQADAQLQEVEQELAVLEEEIAPSGLHDALARRVECEDAVAEARRQLDALAADLQALEAARREQEQGLDPLRARITELQLQEQAARLALEQFAQQLTEAQVDTAALAEWLQTVPEAERKVGWLQGEVQRIGRAVSALGAVNLAALAELEAAREREGYLAAQRDDLNHAMETLEDAIRRIDRETRQLLQETFDVVNGHFGELFPRLFGGGEARLNMTGDEVLDAGVQVMAQPPGKRNSTIHLLSGGEKALTATALVFALFKLNPAPFCLLDEVDAPLDDANTERYANLVRSMSEQTQFLFISHNKIAMEMAHQLVGVTMQEQGVSRIVAVDVEAAVQMMAEPA